jgi:hypothetical protein
VNRTVRVCVLECACDVNVIDEIHKIQSNVIILVKVASRFRLLCFVEVKPIGRGRITGVISF